MDKNHSVKTTYGYKKQHNGPQEEHLEELQNLTLNEQTDKGKKALSEMTKKAQENYPE